MGRSVGGESSVQSVRVAVSLQANRENHWFGSMNRGRMADPSVSVRLRGGTVYVTAAYSPSPGTHIDQEPVLAVRATDAPAVGAAVLTGLRHFTDGGQVPDWSAYPSPILAAAGVRSWNELERGLHSCAVKSAAGCLTILGDAGPKQLPPGASAEEIGLAVLSALTSG